MIRRRSLALLVASVVALAVPSAFSTTELSSRTLEVIASKTNVSCGGYQSLDANVPRVSLQLRAEQDELIRSADMLSLLLRRDIDPGDLTCVAFLERILSKSPVVVSASLAVLSVDGRPAVLFRKPRGGKLISDRSSAAKYNVNGTAGYEWVWVDRGVRAFERSRQNVCAADVEWALKGSEQLGRWTRPYYDCAARIWLVAYSLPVFGCLDRRLITWGYISLQVDLQSLTLDQCGPPEDTPLYRSHLCPPNSKCEPIKLSAGFLPGSYVCRCASDGAAVFNGSWLEQTRSSAETTRIRSELCWTCCRDRECVDSRCDPVELAALVRVVPLVIQSFVIAATIVVFVTVIRLRHRQVLKTSMWPMLQIVLAGALVLYVQLVLAFLQPSDFICLLMPWFREVGFVSLYGALILRIYRIQAEFRSRKAHRVQVRDCDLLKYLLLMLLLACGYLAAWTALHVDLRQRHLTTLGLVPPVTTYRVCKPFWWHIIIELGELLILCGGIYWSHRVRAAPTDYFEARFILAGLVCELVGSTVLYIARHVLFLHLHPDYISLLYFVRCHLGVTSTLLLLLLPKVWYSYRPPADASHQRGYSSPELLDAALPESFKLTGSGAQPDVADVSLNDMDPDDIRNELRRLYGQLQVYKTKFMRKDNPHISKRRGGRKHQNRRFSLQALRYNKHAPELSQADVSKTPEESTASGDGPTVVGPDASADFLLEVSDVPCVPSVGGKSAEDAAARSAAERSAEHLGEPDEVPKNTMVSFNTEL